MLSIILPQILQILKAITAGVKSADAQMYFHYKIPEENTLEVFQENDDFLIRFDNFMQDIGQRPKVGESVGTIPYELPKYTREELIKLVRELKTNAGCSWKNIEPTATIQHQQKGFFHRRDCLFKE